MKLLTFFKRLLLNIPLPYPCKLKESKSADERGARAMAREGDELQIVHAPSEKLPFGVYAYDISLNRVLGLVALSSAKKLVKLFGKGFCKDGEVLARTERGGEFFIEVLVFDRTTMMKNEDFTHLYE
ncbi:MAG: hypothetical protein IJX98_01025 [Clostridia bacterium]|nr:hypothetical protein [Clostridia bacterium]